MKTYKSANEFFKENNLDKFKEHENCYARIVEELDFNICKKILLRQLEQDGITLEKLREKYEQDKYLNNIYKYKGRYWQWDWIGDEMIRNPNAKIKFKLMSDCDRTCVAKACARMVIEMMKRKEGNKNMTELYGLPVLKQHDVYYNGKVAHVFTLTDYKYYNIHVLNDDYNDSRLNTLILQRPIEDITKADVTDELFLEEVGLEFLLRDKFYGHNNKQYNFYIQAVERGLE